MTAYCSNEPMLEMFLFETSNLIGQLEESVLSSEQSNCFTQPAINEIFRIMHTIKGSAAMMMFENIASLAHSIEDLFYFLREGKPQYLDCSALSDLVLEGVDFMKVEMEKIKNGDNADGNATGLIGNIGDFLSGLKKANGDVFSGTGPPAAVEKQQYYISPGKIEHSKNMFKAVVFFDEGCQMENIRAFSIIHHLKTLAEDITHVPEEIVDSDESTDIIRHDGFKVYFRTECSYDKVHEFFKQTVFLKDLELSLMEDEDEIKLLSKVKREPGKQVPTKEISVKEREGRGEENSDFLPVFSQQSIISVSVDKLDKLMNLVGEMVIAEAMVVQNPDLCGMELGNFQKAARQLHKITGEMQDMVMSIRLMPVATTFHKMNRVVRDMSRKLGREVQLKLAGEETEVDKNIIEHISDPLMHLIRNSIDHGIEAPEDRQAAGKPQAGTITLEASNAGSDVLITVKDDGKGLNREKILQQARENDLLPRPEDEMNDREICNLIFLPGFSTKESVSEFSGRGVGMDVVVKNIGAIGGSVSIESAEGAGTAVTLKIPLTLAIIDGMNIRVGNSCYTIPTISIKESFRPKDKDIITDPDENEMIMVRGQCYPILRLHRHFRVKTDVMELTKGILVMVETENKVLCIFADELLGQQQVVVKALPNYIRGSKRIEGLAGCTLLGDGSISLILDINGLAATYL